MAGPMTHLRWRRIALVAVFAMACSGGEDGASESQVYRTGSLEISDVVVPAPLTLERTSVYMRIANRGATGDTLVSITSAIAEVGSLHRMQMTDGMMRMVRDSMLPIPPGEELVLRPGERHGMLEVLREPPVAGDSVEIVVVFARAGELVVWAEVRPYGEILD